MDKQVLKPLRIGHISLFLRRLSSLLSFIGLYRLDVVDDVDQVDHEKVDMCIDSAIGILDVGIGPTSTAPLTDE